jgi:hypothetical protein
MDIFDIDLYRELNSDLKDYNDNKLLEHYSNKCFTPFNISNAEVFSKPHKHLLLGLYC